MRLKTETKNNDGQFLDQVHAQLFLARHERLDIYGYESNRMDSASSKDDVGKKAMWVSMCYAVKLHYHACEYH